MVEIFIIITPNDTIRAKHLEQQLLTQKGIDDFKITYWPATMDYGTPAVGISKSHRSIVQKAKDEGRPEVVIMEDDVVFLAPYSLELFCNTNKYLSKYFPEQFDILFGNIYDGEIWKEYERYAEVRGRVSGLNTYCIKNSYYDTFLGADPAMNLDYWVSSEAPLKPRMYVCWPFVTLQRDNVYSYNLRGVSSHNYQIGEKYRLLS